VRVRAHFRAGVSPTNCACGTNICAAPQLRVTVLSRTSLDSRETESRVLPEGGGEGTDRISGPRISGKVSRGISDRRTIETQTTMNDYITPATAATLELVERVLPTVLRARV